MGNKLSNRIDHKTFTGPPRETRPVDKPEYKSSTEEKDVNTIFPSRIMLLPGTNTNNYSIIEIDTDRNLSDNITNSVNPFISNLFKDERNNRMIRHGIGQFSFLGLSTDPETLISKITLFNFHDQSEIWTIKCGIINLSTHKFLCHVGKHPSLNTRYLSVEAVKRDEDSKIIDKYEITDKHDDINQTEETTIISIINLNLFESVKRKERDDLNLIIEHNELAKGSECFVCPNKYETGQFVSGDDNGYINTTDKNLLALASLVKLDGVELTVKIETKYQRSIIAAVNVINRDCSFGTEVTPISKIPNFVCLSNDPNGTHLCGYKFKTIIKRNKTPEIYIIRVISFKLPMKLDQSNLVDICILSDQRVAIKYLEDMIIADFYASSFVLITCPTKYCNFIEIPCSKEKFDIGFEEMKSSDIGKVLPDALITNIISYVVII